MSSTALALLRSPSGWSGAEVDLSDAADLDGLTEQLRDLATGGDADLVVLLVEEDDEYLAVLRLDDAEDPRVFLSDVRSAESSAGAALLAQSEDLAGDVAPDADELDEDDSAAARAAAVPGGDTALLADLGVPAAALLEVVVEQGRLPAEAVDELAGRLGAADVVEGLRGAV